MTASRLLTRLAISSVALILVAGCSSTGASTAPSAAAPSVGGPVRRGPVRGGPSAAAALTYKDLTVGFIQTGSEGGWRAANTASFKDEADQARPQPEVLRRPEQAREPALGVPQLHRRRRGRRHHPGRARGSRLGRRSCRRPRPPARPSSSRTAASMPPEDLYATYIGSDFTEEGRKAADRDVQAARGQHQQERRRARRQRRFVAGHRPRQGLPREDGRLRHHRHRRARRRTGAPPKARTSWQAFLKKSKDIQGVFAQNDEMGLGAVQALKEAGLKPGEDVKIITVDATKGAFEAMIAGKINTVVECNPLLAPQVYEAALKAVNGEDPARSGCPSIEGIFRQENAAEDPARRASTRHVRRHGREVGAPRRFPARPGSTPPRRVMPCQRRTSLLSMRGIDKAFPGVQALEGVDFDLAARRDPRPRRRERRRQVHPDQGPDRRRTAGCGHDHLRRRGRPRPLPAARPVASGSAPSTRRSTSAPTCRWRRTS